jgi:hypothetical protein
METRERKVAVPYFVKVPETPWRSVTKQVPDYETKVELDSIEKKVNEPYIRTKCEPETRMTLKRIPVCNVVAKPAQPCPADADSEGQSKRTLENQRAEQKS